ncbi:hypothetical protein KM043_006091 [Ampulex compressa]|nr:hypothetical protein KM043_006091 [Ampulex compressa]
MDRWTDDGSRRRTGQHTPGKFTIVARHGSPFDLCGKGFGASRRVTEKRAARPRVGPRASLRLCRAGARPPTFLSAEAGGRARRRKEGASSRATGRPKRAEAARRGCQMVGKTRGSAPLRMVGT